MRLIKLDDKRELALKAIVYGCNTNKRLVGASFMTGIYSDSVETISFYDALSVVDEMMDDAVEAEPVKHGRWILHDSGSGTCDQCRFTQKNVWDYDNAQRYCGVCGAKMDGGADNA